MLPGTPKLVVVALKTTSLVIGVLIVRYAHAAYRRTGRVALLALSAGFGVVTLGLLLGGVVDLLLPLSESLAILTTSAFVNLGFVTILYALWRG